VVATSQVSITGTSGDAYFASLDGSPAMGGAGSGGGGGGGGSGTLDQSTFTQGGSFFSPIGGTFNDGATLSSGQQGTARLTTKRALVVDTDTSGNALYSAITSGVGVPGSAVPSTGIYVGGNVGGNFRGWTGSNPSGSVYAQDGNIASVAGTTLDTNSGNKSNGTPRVVIATDQPNLTTPLNVKSASSYGAAQLSSAAISAASSGNNTLVTRSVGTIKVYGIFFSCASSVVVTLQNGTSTGVTGAMTLTTFFLPISAEPYFTTTSTNNFVMNLGAAVQCSGTIYYLDS